MLNPIRNQSSSASKETRVVSVRGLEPTLATIVPGSFLGAPRVPGYNVDALDVDAGISCARGFNMDDLHLMLVGYGLQRWARGEEHDAEQMIIKGIDGVRLTLTQWRMILAAAMAAANSGVGASP
jgi:hypothetical protein